MTLTDIEIGKAYRLDDNYPYTTPKKGDTVWVTGNLINGHVMCKNAEAEISPHTIKDYGAYHLSFHPSQLSEIPVMNTENTKFGFTIGDLVKFNCNYMGRKSGDTCVVTGFWHGGLIVHMDSDGNTLDAWHHLFDKITETEETAKVATTNNKFVKTETITKKTIVETIDGHAPGGVLFSVTEPDSTNMVQMVIGANWSDRHNSWHTKESLAELIEILKDIHEAL